MTITRKILVSIFSILIFTFFIFFFVDYLELNNINRSNLILFILFITQLLFVNICGPLNSLLISKEHFITAILTNGFYILFPVSVFLLFQFDDFFYFAIINILSLLIVFILQYFLSNINKFKLRLSFDGAFKLLNQSNKNFFYFNLIMIFYPAIEIFFIKYYLGNENLVSHVIYFRLPLLCAAFITQLMTNYFPSVAMKTKKNIATSELYINKLFKSLIIICFLFSMIVFCYNNFFIKIWMGEDYMVIYQILIVIQLITFYESLIWSVQQIILPYNSKYFIITYFILELIFRFIILLIMYKYNYLSYQSFLLVTLITKSILFLFLLKSYRFINIQYDLFLNKYFLCTIFCIYLFSYYFFDNIILLFSVYSIITLIISGAYIFIHRDKIIKLL